MILDQNRAVLVASVICFQKIFGLHGLNHKIIEYWVSRGRYWLVLGGTGSEQGGTGCQCDMLSENIWFTWCNHQIIQYLEKEKVITDRQTNKQTDRISYLRLDPFCGRGRVKISLNKCRALGCEFQYERRKRYISTGGNTV